MVNGIDTIAHRSSRDDGSWFRRKSRWTEIGLYHRANVEQPFLLVIKGKSLVAGENTITTRYRAKSLKLILERLDDGPMARWIREQAAYWAKDNAHA